MNHIKAMICVAFRPAMPCQPAYAPVFGCHKFDNLGVNRETEGLETELAILKKGFTFALVLELDVRGIGIITGLEFGMNQGIPDAPDWQVFYYDLI